MAYYVVNLGFEFRATQFQKTLGDKTINQGRRGCLSWDLGLDRHLLVERASQPVSGRH